MGSGLSDNWVFEEFPPMGGAAGEAYTNTLASSGMPPAEVLARESIQNSVDAHAEDASKVSISFVAKELKGKEKAAFAALTDLGSIRDRVDKLDFKHPNCLDHIEDEGAALKLLYINDYNTTGLEGDPRSPDSKFYRFLLSLGDGGKEHDETGTGGSYGFGKSVYSSNSGILTIFAYSRTVDADGKPISLLFGCGYYRRHKFKETNCTGRAWFGKDSTKAGQPQFVEPLRDADADAMAAKLGFPKREATELGTSVLIVDAVVEADAILRGVEDWWWPRLIDNKIDVRVVDVTGASHLPRPRKRADLRPFLEAFDLATGKSPSNSKTDFRKALKTDFGELGVMGFKVLDRDDKDEFVVGESRVDSVALIRSTMMVIAYYRNWNIGNPAMAGAFIANLDIDNTLRAAEPPAHDRWDKDARRLQDQDGKRRATVEKVLGGIRRHLKTSQNTAAPPPPPRPKRLSILERTLANFLSPGKVGPPDGPNATSAPIHLAYETEPRAEVTGERLRLKSIFTVKLKSGDDVEAMKLRLRASCPVVEDGQLGESLTLQMTSSAPFSDTSADGWKYFDIKAGETVRIECVSEPYDPLWTVRFVPEVEEVEGV